MGKSMYHGWEGMRGVQQRGIGDTWLVSAYIAWGPGTNVHSRRSHVHGGGKCRAIARGEQRHVQGAGAYKVEARG